MKRLLLSVLLVFSVAVARARPRPVAELFSPQDSNPAILSSSPWISGATSLLNDTTYFGGTRWAPDSMRWEAIKDSMWTFDTGVGSFIKEAGKSYPDVNPYKPDGFHGGMEGWVGRDNTYAPVPYFRRLGAADPRWGGFPCVGSGSGLGGEYSFWVGVLPAEAESLSFASGKGYGNTWHVCIEHVFSYAGGAVQLAFQYRNESEELYDYSHVYCDTSGEGDLVEVVAYTGFVSGTADLTLTPGIELPLVPKPVKLEFCFDSDAAWSDQDGLTPTDCGAFAVDNISLTGAITHATDFETSEDGWLLSAPSPGVGGDWSNLAFLGDLPPLPDSLTAQCAFRDSVMVFFDPATGRHPTYQDNVAISPWIDFERFGMEGNQGYFIDLDGYIYLPLRNYLFVETAAQWFPDTCSVTGQVTTSRWTSNNFVYYFGGLPVCRSGRPLGISFTGIIPPKVDEVRIAVGVVNYCRFFTNCTGIDNSSPWFDNLRFATYSFTTIQDAIDQAASGDTVWVPPGDYTKPGDVNLTFRGKNIVLKSVGGPQTTVIDGSGTYRGLVCDQGEDSTAAVIGFTFTNCTAPKDSLGRQLDGGAVHIGSGASVRFEDCRFMSSTAMNGGGIFAATDARPSFSRCTFLNNTAKYQGGGANVGTARFVDCRFDSNQSSVSGGGAFARYPGYSEFIRVLILDTKNGLGAVLEGEARVEDCTFEKNQDGGLKLRGQGIVRNSLFIENQGTGLIFGIYEGLGIPGPCGSRFHVSNCRVMRNSDGGISGCGGTVDSTFIQGNQKYGGVYAVNVRLSHCTIVENSGYSGGGIYLESGFVENCVISGNRALGDGGGIFGYAASGIYLSQTFQIQNCVITGNGAKRGGGLSITRFLPDLETPHFLRGVTITSNRAEWGAGVFLGQRTLLDIEHSILWGNEADSAGAQVYLSAASDSVAFVCSDVDSFGVAGRGHVEYDGSQIIADPLFCRPALAEDAPTTAGDYTLAFDSPCLPIASPCDSLIGALGQGCDVVSVVPPPDPQEPPFLKTPGIHAGPNPFQSALTIHYLSPIGTEPKLEIFSVDGRLVGRWSLSPGSGIVTWNGTDPIGHSVASGIYVLRYTAGDLRVVRRVVRLP